MSSKPRNLGRAYLVSDLGKHGVSRRLAVALLDFVFKEMRQALARNEEVEFPFGRLVRVKQVNRRWELAGDEPVNAYTVEHELDAAGYKLLPGEKDPAELAFLIREDRLRRPLKAPRTGK